MSFVPIVPTGGPGGWAFLKRTEDMQQAAFAKSPDVQRDDRYFRERIASIGSAEELVSDRRLLKVALGAFGLDDDINNRFFLRKVLEDGTTSDTALSSRLSDKRYRAFAEAFGFGPSETLQTAAKGFADDILSLYRSRQFEVAVGRQSGSLRLALTAERTVAELAARPGSDAAKWFQMMGSPPMRTVFQTALGLPASIASIDIDQQLKAFRDKASDVLGIDGFADLADPGKIDVLIRRYLSLTPSESGFAALTRGSGALQLLQAGAGPSSSIINLRQRT